MKDLIERSYEAIRKRGMIDSDTHILDFIIKMKEEYEEIYAAYHVDEDFDATIKEVTDLMTVCIMALQHHGFDPIKEFEKCVIHQETRKD
jgi:phosphoribosyl-ATP pyrophosphohydrolase